MSQVKPKVLVLTLGSRERGGWVNPDLMFSLLKMSRDARYAVEFANIIGFIPHDYARNKALATARQVNPDWTVQLDNDIAFPNGLTPLDIIAGAPSDADVVGVRYGITNQNDKADMYPPRKIQFMSQYQEVTEVPGGCLCIRNSVWQKIPRGPWFQIQVKPNSELLEWGFGEDVSFCMLVRQAGMKVYCYKTPASHFHTMDVTHVTMQQ